MNQKAKLLEVKSEYGVYDQQRRKIASVREVGISLTRLAMGGNDGTRRLQILDTQGPPA